MRKLLAIVTVGALLGVASSRAQTTNFTQGLDIAISGKLIPSGTLVSNESLSGNTNALSFIHLEIINGTTTNLERWIGQINGSTTNLYLVQRCHVDFTPSAAPTYKFALGFLGFGQQGTSSNATLLATGTEIVKVAKGTTNVTVKAKLGGIWVTGTDAGGEKLLLAHSTALSSSLNTRCTAISTEHWEGF